MTADREAEYQRIRQVIADLEAAGITIYKIALILGLQYNAVGHWKRTGRVQSFDAARLESLHRQYCQQRPIYTPQYCKVLTISTTPAPA